MPVLDDPRHEAFAQGLANGLTISKAYISAGYGPDDARIRAYRLVIRNPDVSLRQQELTIQLSNEVIAGVVAREISDRNARITELQARWDWLRTQLKYIVEERSAALAEEAPGGASGLLVRHWIKGKGKDHVVYRIDRGVLRLIRLLQEHERRAAEELGQLGGKAGIPPEKEELPDFSRLNDEDLDDFLRLIFKLSSGESEEVTEMK